MAALTIALAQLNPIVGDIAGNFAALRQARRRAAGAGVDLLVTTELYACGYPSEDLVVKPSFYDALYRAIEALVAETADGGPAILLGAPWRAQGRLYNAVLLLAGGRIAAQVCKRDLPNYGPFDEKRIFDAGPLSAPVTLNGVSLGIIICEDMWTPEAAASLKRQGAEILIVINGSPYEVGKPAQRHSLAVARVRETGLPLAYVNQLGGQDELVFDGGSFVLNARDETVIMLGAWEEKTGILSYEKGEVFSKEPAFVPPMDDTVSVYHALMLGLRDYVRKNKFPGVLLGLSGGIDSALAAAVAVDALGAERVRGVMMPSPYTSQDSLNDASHSARMLGCHFDTISISDAMDLFDAALSPVLGDALRGVPQENIQARSRGMILMALSNATGHMVLATGNKSEMAVGYATLYGDMCGGFAVLKDVYKTRVYELARWRNAHKPALGLGPAGMVIPERVLTKAPTAELRPDQKDQDSLPPYDVLDGILEQLIEQDKGLADIAQRGVDAATVARVWAMLDGAEYKRRQAPPGVKITPRNLGRDRRYPITNRYRETL